MGRRRVYGYPGDGINGIIGAFGRSKDKIAFVQARHEELAAFGDPDAIRIVIASAKETWASLFPASEKV